MSSNESSNESSSGCADRSAEAAHREDGALGERFAAAMLGGRAGAPNLVRRGRHFNAAWIVQIGALRYWLQTDQGRLVACRTGVPLMQSSRLTFAASAAVWEAFWQPVPVAGAHDLFALTKRGALRIEGDMHLLLSNLQYLKDVLALPREEATQ